MEKVLFIRRSVAFGGVEVLLLDWLKHINYKKHSIVFASTIDFFTDEIQKNGLPVEYKKLSLPIEGNFMDIYKSWSGYIKSISPDKIVLIHGDITEIPLPSVLAAYIATRGNVYMTEHLAWPSPPKRNRSLHYGIFPGLGLWWYKMMWGIRIRGYLPKRILAVSEGVKKTLLMYGYPSHKIAIAYHGVDVSLFSPSVANNRNWRQRHNIPENDLVIVSTSRLYREKHVERIIKAYDTLSQYHDNLWLLIAGDGPLRKEIETAVHSMKNKDKIKLLGLVKNVPEILQASDIFVLPSDREGLSVSLTEAMSTGLICISSDVSGANEVIIEGENGFLVEPSVEGVYNGIQKVLGLDVPARKVIAQNARNHIVEHFEIKNSISNILTQLDIEWI